MHLTPNEQVRRFGAVGILFHNLLTNVEQFPEVLAAMTTCRPNHRVCGMFFAFMNYCCINAQHTTACFLQSVFYSGAPLQDVLRKGSRTVQFEPVHQSRVSTTDRAYSPPLCSLNIKQSSISSSGTVHFLKQFAVAEFGS